MNILDWLVDKWLKACPHRDEHVATDILEGSGRPFQEVKYCRRCGAVMVLPGIEWRRPRPLWYPKNGVNL